MSRFSNVHLFITLWIKIKFLYSKATNTKTQKY